MKRVTFFGAYVRRRMAANHLGIILEDFANDLQSAGYLRCTIQEYPATLVARVNKNLVS